MKKSLYISSSFDQPGLIENLVEKLATRRHDIGYGNEKMPAGQVAVETASTETYVNGTIVLDDGNEHFNIPFITCFLFTCIKGKEDSYKLRWSSSLS